MNLGSGDFDAGASEGSRREATRRSSASFATASSSVSVLLQVELRQNRDVCFSAASLGNVQSKCNDNDATAQGAEPRRKPRRDRLEGRGKTY